MIEPFISDPINWKELVRLKHLLFDANALINIQKLKCTSLLDELSSIQCTPTYIHPVLVELMRTHKTTDRLEIQRILDKYHFVQLFLQKNIVEKATELQQELYAHQCFPSPADLYLGATVAIMSTGQYLLTSNHKDFPEPLFKREAQIIIQDEKNMQILSVLSYKGNI